MDIKAVKKEIQNEIKMTIKSFEFLIKFIDEHDYKYVSRIINNNDSIYEKNDENTKEILLKLGKKSTDTKEEFRREVAYLLVSRAISGISKNASNVAKYISNVEGKGVDKNWIKKVSERMLRRLEALKRLMTYESVESANALIERDKSLGKMFKDIISSYVRSSVSRSKLTSKEKDEVVQGFVVAIREMEQTGDSIKEAAEAILYIQSGKF